MTINWAGVYPAVTTKFDAQHLDQTAYQQHIRALVASGVDGILVAGSLGENSTLSFEE